MSDYYHLHAEAYHEATFHIDPASFLRPLADRVPPGALSLDVGYGSGRDLRWLRHRGFRAVGLERSPGLARLARDHAGCPVLEADFTLFDFSPSRGQAPAVYPCAAAGTCFDPCSRLRFRHMGAGRRCRGLRVPPRIGHAMEDDPHGE